MKKLLLSVFVVFAFGFYASFYNKSNSVPNLPLTKNPTTQNSDSSQVTQTLPGKPAAIQTGSNTPSYKDGTYTGPVEDAYYGNIQIQAIISGGKLADVKFLQYPNDQRESLEINGQAMPELKQEAISAQSANVDIVSRATDSSRAFRISLAAALSQAKS